MSNNNEPLIKLEPGGKAPVLSYNIPEPTSYSGQNFIELEFPDTYFQPSTMEKPSETVRTPLKNMDYSALVSTLRAGMKAGFTDSKLFPNVRVNAGALRLVEKSNPGSEIASDQASWGTIVVTPDDVASAAQSGMRFNIYTSMFGALKYLFLPEPQVARPRFYLIETYRLSSYLGSYGAGRTIKTFSLLPGEKTKISIKTYMKRESDAKSASSILDSFTQESADDFEKNVQNEQTDKQNYAKTFEYHAEAEASCSWGFGSAKVSGGVKGGTNSAREEFAKNVSNSVQKHAAKASAKRDVQINTSYEVKEETGEETSIEREIQNINVSRTLNFVFRQMNQEFITILHLVDVRVGFFNGFAESKREVTLPELDTLLEEVVVDESKRQEVRSAIIGQLETIVDYKDQLSSFVEEKVLSDQDRYLRARKDLVSTYKDEATGTEIQVPGIILAAMKSVLRTEGIIVEALLGQGDSLDLYSHCLQDEAIRAKTLANELLQAQLKREELGRRIVEAADEAAMKIYQGIFPRPTTIYQEGIFPPTGIKSDGVKEVPG